MAGALPGLHYDDRELLLLRQSCGFENSGWVATVGDDSVLCLTYIYLFEFRGTSRSTTTWGILVTMRRFSACCIQVGGLSFRSNYPYLHESLLSTIPAVYSIPNIFLPFFGGYFVDRFGVRLTLFATTLFITAGQIVFAVGLSAKSWPIMLLGRVVYGFGGESLGVANSAVLADWFKGKELAFAFGLNLSVARLGSVANNLISPALASSSGVVFALWFGVFLCAAR